MDEIDRAIIRALRSDGRMPNAALAEAVGLSPSACLRRLRLLERNGTIRGYTVVVEDAPARDAVTVIVQITLERQTDLRFLTGGEHGFQPATVFLHGRSPFPDPGSARVP